VPTFDLMPWWDPPSERFYPNLLATGLFQRSSLALSNGLSSGNGPKHLTKGLGSMPGAAPKTGPEARLVRRLLFRGGLRGPPIFKERFNLSFDPQPHLNAMRSTVDNSARWNTLVAQLGSSILTHHVNHSTHWRRC